MSRIVLLDAINIMENTQIVRLKKIYNITLFELFPYDIKHIIHDYVHDVINMKIERTSCVTTCYIINQYINCTCISFNFSYNYRSYTFKILECDPNIALVRTCGRTYPHSAILNGYMKQYYSQSCYFDNRYFYNTYYTNFTCEVNMRNNILTYYDNYNVCSIFSEVRQVLTIQINNHKLFKNMIVIIKCIEKKLISCNN